MADVFDPVSFAEGNSGKKNTLAATIPTTNSQFSKMIVLDVVSDPGVATDEKVEYWKSVLGVTNIKYAKVLPRNTIIAISIGRGHEPMFVFPFFPSHLAMPSKPGETVWVLLEDPNSPLTGMVYWVSKVNMPHYVDDVNIQHNPRISEISFFPGLIETAKEEIKTYYELRNGPIRTDENDIRGTSVDDCYLVLKSRPKEDIFEDLLMKSDSGKMSNWESVPRFKKRPGDVAIEGSNNSLIVLGTDRAGPISGYEQFTVGEGNEKNDYGPVPIPSASDLAGFAGSIDLVAGRGQTQATGGKTVDTTSIIDAGPNKSGTSFKKEIGKSENELESQEGDPDLKNDSSRVRISQRTMTDTNFNLSSFNSKEFTISDTSTGDAAVVIKTDKMRIVARSDVEILVTNFSPMNDARDPTKPPTKNEKDTTDDWAAIVIRANGDIIFRPSKLGYIKLGSDKANKAIMCADLPAEQNQGTITSSPIFSTGNDLVCTSQSGQGTFAKKVLVD